MWILGIFLFVLIILMISIGANKIPHHMHKQHNIGGDPATWSPTHNIGGDPATWSPTHNIGGDPNTWSPMK
jgi:hypothetical protein